MPTNENHTMPEATPLLPDPHGQAALLLVESLIHGLCENAVLDPDEAIEVAARAVYVQAERAEAADGAGAPLWRAHELLSAIAASLKIDGSDASTALG